MTTDSISNKALRDRFLGELENSVTVLEGVETAAVGEAWASSAVSEWLALGGSLGSLATHLSSHPQAVKVIEWVEGGDAPGGDGWLGDVGTHQPVEAWDLQDPKSPGERGVIVAFEAESGDRHDVSITIADDQLLAVVVGPAGLADATKEDDSGSGVVAESMDLGDATALIRKATSTISADLSVVSEASLPLLFRRFGVPLGISSSEPEVAVELAERDQELDLYGADVIRSALRKELAAEPSEAAQDALRACQARFAASEPDAATLAEVAGLASTAELTMTDLYRLAGAYFAPVTLAPHSVVEQEALAQLEVADWIGVVLGLTRARVGTHVDGQMLVKAINAAPEITTTIPKKHAAALGWTFETMLYAWEVTGVLIDGTVGPAAKWILPQAAIQTWDSASS